MWAPNKCLFTFCLSLHHLVVNLHSIDGISDRWQLVIAMGKLVEVVV